MTSIKDVQRWIATLDPENQIAVDDGGLTIVELTPDGAWLAGKLTVIARSGLEFVHTKYLSTMIARGDLTRDVRDVRMLVVTEQAVTRYKLPALSTIKSKRAVERVSALAPVTEMTETEKSLAAKLALEAKRSDQEILRKGVSEPSPVKGLAVRLYVDDPKVGCGERGFLVREIGAKLVRLFYPALLAEIQVDRLTFDRFAKPYAIKVQKVLDRIDQVAAIFDRNDIEYSPRATAQACRRLQAA